MSIVHVTSDNFESEILKSDQPVLVDFWAEWCAPCKVLGPTIDELAAEYHGRAKVGKVDVDSNRQIGMDFGITNIPTVILFHNGEATRKFVGLAPKDEFSTALDEALT